MAMRCAGATWVLVTLATLTALAALTALVAAVALKIRRDDEFRRSPNDVQRRRFMVHKNLFRPPRAPNDSAHEAVTFCTHGHFHYFDSLRPLLLRWEGPVSLAVHAPGSDRELALSSIRWARACLRDLQVAERVSFHLFWEHFYLKAPLNYSLTALQGRAPNCSAPPPWANVSAAHTFRGRHRLRYPINTARNVAREAASTRWLLEADLELLPSPGLGAAFMALQASLPPTQPSQPPRVFALPTFEVEAGHDLPRNKTQLVEMVRRGTAAWFHEKECDFCHRLPRRDEWLAANVSDGLHVFHVAKRTGPFRSWEATYIGTGADPAYDERLCWEGGKNRRVTAYVLCALDYEYHILDNAFLAHKPGIEKTLEVRTLPRFVRRTDKIIDIVILPELKIKYGKRPNCDI